MKLLKQKFSYMPGGGGGNDGGDPKPNNSNISFLGL